MKRLALLSALALAFMVFVSAPHLSLMFENNDPAHSTAAPGRNTLVPDTGILWGAYIHAAPWDMGAQDQFEALVGKPASLMHLGITWQRDGEYAVFGRDGYFPSSAMEDIYRRGSIPVLTWLASDTAHGPEQPDFRSAEVARGLHDEYIREFARGAREWDRPFFLRLNPEMNGWWSWPWMEKLNDNQAGDFVRAWRHVHDIFMEERATNAVWVWSPNVISHQSTPLRQLYPGDAYVDWTALDGYNRADPWLSFTKIFATSYYQTLALAPDKPMMIGEFATTENGNDGGERKARWIEEALTVQIPDHYPQVKAVNYYHAYHDMPFQVDSSAASAAAFRAAVGRALYLPAGPR